MELTAFLCMIFGGSIYIYGMLEDKLLLATVGATLLITACVLAITTTEQDKLCTININNKEVLMIESSILNNKDLTDNQKENRFCKQI